MLRKTTAIIIMAAFAANIGRCADYEKGKLYYFSDTDTRIVAQKLKDGVLLWSRDDLAKGKSWHDADNLILLRLKDTSKIKKGMSSRRGWFKYVGMHRHGNLFVGHRDIPMFEIPSKEEIAQAEYQLREEDKKKQEELERQENEKLAAELKRIQEENDRRREEVERKLQEKERKLQEEKRKREMELEEEKKRQEQAKKDEEERKRRYPIEQKQRAEYAAMKLRGISFDWRSYVRMQTDLYRYVYSIELTDKMWAELHNLQLEKNWLGMLGAIAGHEIKDYPNESNIDSFVKQLRRKNFHLSLMFTHNIELFHFGGGQFKDFQDLRYVYYPHGEAILVFNMEESINGKIVIYTRGKRDLRSLYEEASCKKSKIHKDMKLGRLHENEGYAALRQVDEELAKKVSVWFDTELVPIRKYKPIHGREKAMQYYVSQSSAVEKPYGGTPKTKPQWVACPDCGGSRYVSEGRCDNCGGEGRYRTPITHGIGGRPSGGRMTQCEKCKGKGEIRKICKRCSGNGRIRQ